MRPPAKYYALLSGEHPLIPLGELRGILEAEAGSYEIIAHYDGIALFNADIPRLETITERAGWVKEVGILLAVTDDDPRSITTTITNIRDKLLENGQCLEYARYKGYASHIDDKNLKASLREILTCTNRRSTVRVFITEGLAFIGLVRGRLDTRSLMLRRPGRRPFFRPGPLSPQLTRAMINLARARRGEAFLDPFCGTGGFAIEASIIGCRPCLCGELVPVMIRGARTNISHYRLSGSCLVFAHNAASMPVRGEAIHAIATDPPYGRSTTTKRYGYEGLVRLFLEEAGRVLVRDGYLVFAGPVSERPDLLAVDSGFQVVEKYEMHVHSSLTRMIVVARKR